MILTIKRVNARFRNILFVFCDLIVFDWEICLFAVLLLNLLRLLAKIIWNRRANTNILMWLQIHLIHIIRGILSGRWQAFLLLINNLISEFFGAL